MRGGRRASNVYIAYEEPASDLFSADRSLHPSTDGSRLLGRQVNVRQKKRRIAPSDLDDVYAAWTPHEKTSDENSPSNGDMDENAYYGDDQQPEAPSSTGEKRRRYVSSVSRFLFLDSIREMNVSSLG